MLFVLLILGASLLVATALSFRVPLAFPGLRIRLNPILLMDSESSKSLRTDMATSSGVINFLSRVYSMTPRNVISASVTGGGVGALQRMFTIPGASNSLMDGCIPYSRGSLTLMKRQASYAASVTDKSVTSENAIQMAIISRKRAVEMLLEDTNNLNDCRGINAIGLACTAKLAGKTPAKGDHRLYVALADKHCVSTYFVKLRKGSRNREEEDLICSSMMLGALSDNIAIISIDSKDGKQGHEDEFQMSDLGNELFDDEMIVSEKFSYRDRDGGDALDNLYSGKTNQILFMFKREENDERAPVSENEFHVNLEEFDYYEDIKLPDGAIIYPGSFHPLHEGHIKLVQSALEFHNSEDRPVVFEIAAINADKSALPREELLLRVKHLLSSPELRRSNLKNFAVSVTRKPLFLQKAELFKGCVFVIGADTMIRMLNPKYYGNPAEAINGKNNDTSAMLAMVAALATIHGHGNTFVVGGRKGNANDDFLECDTILASEPVCKYLPEHIKQMFQGLQQDQFRVDLSSTEIRQEMQSKQEKA